MFEPWISVLSFFLFGATAPQWARASSFTRFLDHTQRRNTVGRTPLDGWSAPTQRHLPDNTQHSQQTDIHGPPVGFEPTISAGERPQTYALTFWTRNFFFSFSTPVYKMRIIQEPNTIELWNKLHFEEKKNFDYTPCLKYSVPIFVE